jgi:hypothetical protein
VDYHESGDPEISLALVNPEIVRARGRVLGYEGCLSIPGWTGEVPRAEVVTVKAIGLDNKPIRIKAHGWGPACSSTKSITSMASCSLIGWKTNPPLSRYQKMSRPRGPLEP